MRLDYDEVRIRVGIYIAMTRPAFLSHRPLERAKTAEQTE